MNAPILYCVSGAMLSALGTFVFSYGFYKLGSQKDVPKQGEIIPHMRAIPHPEIGNGRNMDLEIGISNKSEYMAKNVTVILTINKLEAVDIGGYGDQGNSFDRKRGQFFSDRVYPDLGVNFPNIGFNDLRLVDFSISIVAEDVRRAIWNAKVIKNNAVYEISIERAPDLH